MATRDIAQIGHPVLREQAAPLSREQLASPEIGDAGVSHLEEGASD